MGTLYSSIEDLQSELCTPLYDKWFRRWRFYSSRDFCVFTKSFVDDSALTADPMEERFSYGVIRLTAIAENLYRTMQDIAIALVEYAFINNYAKAILCLKNRYQNDVCQEDCKRQT